VVAWFALRIPELDLPLQPGEDPPADVATAPMEPLG